LSLAVVISHNDIQGGLPMRLSYAIRGALTALTVAALATAAYADSGSIRFNVVKAGFVIGGSAGGGTLLFHGRRYPLSIGGISYGFTFGASATDFVGTVTNIRRPSDVNGVYGAAGAGAAIGRGVGGIVLTNQNGAVLTLSGRQAGLIVAADLNGLVITVR
jgi:lipid-binding SYLF domain-containing protein